MKAQFCSFESAILFIAYNYKVNKQKMQSMFCKRNKENNVNLFKPNQSWVLFGYYCLGLLSWCLSPVTNPITHMQTHWRLFNGFACELLDRHEDAAYGQWRLWSDCAYVQADRSLLTGPTCIKHDSDQAQNCLYILYMYIFMSKKKGKEKKYIKKKKEKEKKTHTKKRKKSLKKINNKEKQEKKWKKKKK